MNASFHQESGESRKPMVARMLPEILRFQTMNTQFPDDSRTEASAKISPTAFIGGLDSEKIKPQ
jgi:hypothetical protein